MISSTATLVSSNANVSTGTLNLKIHLHSCVIKRITIHIFYVFAIFDF